MTGRVAFARILGIDYGRKRIGVAASDPLGMMAHPLDTLEGTPERAIETIAALAKDREIARIVVGLPLNMDGTDSDMTREARAFAAKVKAATALPVELLDERLSSAGAEDALRGIGLKPGKHKGKVDAIAACELVSAALGGAKGTPA